MALTFEQLKQRVGKNVKYYDNTDGWRGTLGQIDLTEGDVGDFINEIYIEEQYPLWSSRFPHIFRQTAFADNWIATGVVDTSSTGSTLVTTGSVFTNGMVGLKVYNSTDDETGEISAYTSATTVTLDGAIGDSWDGDTIYILGREFSFGGDTSDITSVQSISLKYNSSAINYIPAEIRDEEDIFQTGGEVGSPVSPLAYLTNLTSSTGVKTAGFGILPKFTEKISKAIKVIYVAEPVELSSGSDKPMLPIRASLIAGATARAYEKLQKFTEASYWWGKYERAQIKDLSRFRDTTNSRPIRLKVDRKTAYMHRRII